MLLFISGIFFSCEQYDSKEITMYYPDSVPKIEAFYKYYGNNQYVAKEIRYYPNRQIAQESYFTNGGLRDGKWIYYFENGEKWREENYSKGKKDGKEIEWYKSGKKMYQAEYMQDLPHGTWIIWDENGKKIATEEYEYGVLIE